MLRRTDGLEGMGKDDETDAEWNEWMKKWKNEKNGNIQLISLLYRRVFRKNTHFYRNIYNEDNINIMIVLRIN